MHLLVFVVLLGVCKCDVGVSVDRLTGEYNVSVGERVWLRSSYTRVYVDDRWYSSNDGSLPLVDTSLASGSDTYLGVWNETRLIYSLNVNGRAINVTGGVRQWSSLSAITFHFDTGNATLSSTVPLDMDRVRTVFPSFQIEQIDEDDHRGYVSFGGMMMGDLEKDANTWDSSSRFIKTGMSGGPLVIFNLTQHGQGDAIVVSPFSQFMSSSFCQNSGVLEYGVMGSISPIPANHNHSLIIFYSSAGVNQAMRQWGQSMQRAFNRTNEHRLNDLTINYLGYYTDNGAYYYYHTEKGMNYEDTIVSIVGKHQLPIHYVQVDSWWYYKGLGDGVTQWTARPDIFPDGLAGLSRRLEKMPLAAHNRYWASNTDYANQYAFIMDRANEKSLPLGNDSFWIDLLSEASRDWGLILYEQDWMNHQTIDFTPTRTDIDLGRQWLISMGQAADKVGINIQYCMSLPRHALQALEISRVTQARVSDDYFVHIVQRIPQWNIGVTSMLADALGMAPFKDIFWSTSVQNGAPYISSVKEPLPDREIIIATLSTGPVAYADGLNYTNVTRIMRCCRPDGLILKPSRPLTMIDVLIADWAQNHGVMQGQLYSTATTLNNETFSIIFASSMRRDYSLVPSMIDAPPGILWSYDDPSTFYPFNDTSPLQVSASRCSDSSFCLWYASPLWHFNDTNSTAYALLGEVDKWTAVSRQRFISLVTNVENTETIINVAGVPDEVISLLLYHSRLSGVIRLICSLSADQHQAQLRINPFNVTCN